MILRCRICAITIYRVQATSKIGDPTNLQAQDTYCLIALLTSLEALLGVISACLPLLKPVFHKLRDTLSERGTNPTASSGIPSLMHRSQTPASSSRKQYTSEFTSTTYSLSDEGEVEEKCERDQDQIV